MSSCDAVAHSHRSQGLFFHNGFLYESTGLYGFSSLRKVRVDTGEVVQKVDLDDNMFGALHCVRAAARQHDVDAGSVTYAMATQVKA